MEWWSDRIAVTPTLQHSKQATPVSLHSQICGMEPGFLSLFASLNSNLELTARTPLNS